MRLQVQKKTNNPLEVEGNDLKEKDSVYANEAQTAAGRAILLL